MARAKAVVEEEVTVEEEVIVIEEYTDNQGIEWVRESITTIGGGVLVNEFRK